jgi:hypothetical protein
VLKRTRPSDAPMNAAPTATIARYDAVSFELFANP